MYLYMYIYIYVCMYIYIKELPLQYKIYMYVCMYVCMYICMRETPKYKAGVVVVLVKFIAELSIRLAILYVSMYMYIY